MALRISASLDERVMEPFLARDKATGKLLDDPVLTPMYAATKFARDEANSLVALERAVFADQTRTDQARTVAVADAANKSALRVTERLDEVRAKVVAAIEREENLSAAPPPPITAIDISREAEIRTALKAMSDKERTDVISAAFAEQRMSVVAAVLHADAFLSGIKDAKLADLRHKFREAHHPGSHARIANLRKALDVFDRVGNLFVALSKEASATPAARLAAANAQRAQEALAAHGAR